MGGMNNQINVTVQRALCWLSFISIALLFTCQVIINKKTSHTSRYNVSQRTFYHSLTGVYIFHALRMVCFLCGNYGWPACECQAVLFASVLVHYACRFFYVALYASTSTDGGN